jgi:hypothetical protein
LDIVLPEKVTANSTAEVIVRDDAAVTSRRVDVELENAYEVKLYLDGGIVRQVSIL